MRYKDICSSTHEVKNQRVIAKRTSQIMKYGQDVIIQKRTDDNMIIYRGTHLHLDILIFFMQSGSSSSVFRNIHQKVWSSVPSSSLLMVFNRSGWFYLILYLEELVVCICILPR